MLPRAPPRSRTRRGSKRTSKQATQATHIGTKLLGRDTYLQLTSILPAETTMTMTMMMASLPVLHLLSSRSSFPSLSSFALTLDGGKASKDKEEKDGDEGARWRKR